LFGRVWHRQGRSVAILHFRIIRYA
jgi:hypothetical protein